MTAPITNPQYEALYDGGVAFHPLFLRSIAWCQALRFVSWMMTDYGSTQGSWGKRPLPTDATWATKKGVPLEVMVDLCNLTHKAPWFNLPHASNLTYNREFSKQVEATLRPDLPVYVELSNEIWNGAPAYQPQQAYFIADGRRRWPASTEPDYVLGFRAYALKAAVLSNIWKQRLGDRVTFVLSGQAANIGVMQLMLAGLPWDHSIEAIAIGAYFGHSQITGTLDDFFTNQVPTHIDKWEGFVRGHLALAVENGFKLLAYEGGQGYVNPTDMSMAANRDERMGDATAEMLRRWSEITGNALFMYYSPVKSFNTFGCWGALETVMQPTHPKYEAVKTYRESGGNIGGVMDEVNYHSSQMAFSNAVKSGTWTPQKPGADWGMGTPLDLDANGYINSVPSGESVGMLLYRNFPSVN